MANYTERIRLLFDVDGGNSNSNLGKLVSNVKNADGALGKMKAGVSGVAGMLKENMGAALIAAGTAAVAYGAKALKAFEDTATSARELGDAVGLSTEDASRWIAVADDMEVSADQLTTGLGRVAKTLDSSKWAEYGIATRDASGNARDTNDILLDTFDMLGKITNETQRAKVGNELFGKGYKDLAPLIGKSRVEYEGMLKAVDGGQVITEKESAKAERMRLAQDALSDSLESVTLATGEFVANLAPLIELMAKVVTITASVQDATENLARDLVGLNDGPLAGVALGFGTAQLAAENLAHAVDNTSGPMTAARDYMKQLEGRSKDAAREVHGLAKTADELRAELDKADGALQILKGHIDDRQAWRNAQDAVAELNTKMADQEVTWGELADAADDAALAYADVIEQADNIPPEVKTRLYQELDAGNLEEVQRMLERWQQGYRIPLYPKVVTSSGGPNPGAVIPIVGAFADGGTVPGPVGKAQLAVVHGGEEITSVADVAASKSGASGGGDTYVTNVHITTTLDERGVVAVLKKYVQRGGNI